MEYGPRFPGRLTWLPEAGVGYYPVENAEATYDGAYFERYQQLADTDLGRRLTEQRVQLVERHADYTRYVLRLDVGVGSGQFIAHMAACGLQCFGYDINPTAVAWLKRRERYYPLWGNTEWDVMTFWDSLEHLADPRPMLRRCKGYAFVALPIFTGADHALRSKHFRRDEHYWYFTRQGFVRFAEHEGFEVVDITATETAMGREDIETFVLRRVA